LLAADAGRYALGSLDLLIIKYLVGVHMKSVAFFNNKGGVGKTTLLCNVASIFATEFNSKVAVIDCDPQCNSTQLILSSDKVLKLYSGTSHRHSMREVVEPLAAGDREPNIIVEPSEDNEFSVDLFPGHPELALIEDKLSANWQTLAGGEVEGFRINLWLKYFLTSLEEKFDYIFIDVGPSLGAINRTVLLGVDAFVTPLGADIFSIMGVKNIASWIKEWANKYQIGYKHVKSSMQQKYSIPETIDSLKGFLGYTVQQYTTKSDTSGERRKVAAFDKIIKKMPTAIAGSLGQYSKVPDDELGLGDIPYLYSLVPLAQSSNVPIHKLTGEHGLRGSRYTLAKKYRAELLNVAETLYTRLS
jgi:cellulose biosynthesis protein BcsQ